jgi:hypothetical protein
MAGLTGNSISGTYDRLLALPSNGGDGSNLVPLTDGDGVTTFALQISDAGIKSTGTLTVAGIVDFENTTDSSDFTGDTGALRCEGGASIAKKLYVGSQTYINNHLYLPNDGAQLHFGDTGDGSVKLEHYNNNGLFLVATTDSSKQSSTAVNLSLYHSTSGTAANGIGNTIEFRCESAGGSVKQHAYQKAIMVNATDGAEDTDFTWMLMNDGSSAQEKMRLLSTGNLGIGTSVPTHKLHVNGSARVSGHFMRTRNNVTIASGVANVTAGGFVNLQAESSTSDNLDFIQVNGTTPDIGTELYLVADTGDTITLRMGTHSGVTDGATALSCIMADEDDTAAAARDEIVLASGWTILHVVYNGRWVVMNPLVARVNNE